MAEDDIERLLREVNALGNAGSAPDHAAARQGGSDLEPAAAKSQGAGGRLAFAIGSGVVLGGAGWFVGLVLPFVGSFSSGLGAALGGFVAALVAGPPRWFSS